MNGCGVSKIGAARVKMSSKNKREEMERDKERGRVGQDKASARDHRPRSCGQQFHRTITERRENARRDRGEGQKTNDLMR
jgi:hypothetical protein